MILDVLGSYYFNMCVPRTSICLKYNKIEDDSRFWCMMVYNRHNQYEIYYHLPCLKENGSVFEQKPNFYIHNNFLWDVVYPELVHNETSLRDNVNITEVTETTPEVTRTTVPTNSATNDVYSVELTTGKSWIFDLDNSIVQSEVLSVKSKASGIKLQFNWYYISLFLFIIYTL